jgi:hypothetical protein
VVLRFLNRAVFLACLAALLATPTVRADMPPWLPHYDLDVKIDVEGQCVIVKEQVRWTNPSSVPTGKIVFNAHSHYEVPDDQVGLLAKMLELLRLSPKDGLDFNGPPLNVQAVSIVGGAPGSASVPAAFGYAKDNATALEVTLPGTVGPGESITLEVNFKLRLPQRQGRWGQWKGVTFLAQWLPVVAYYGEGGWQPTPFVPWHQPFFNEAGHYTVKVVLPIDQKLAASSGVLQVHDLGNDWQQIDLAPICVRDFALFCSADYHEFTAKAGPVDVRVVALPGREWYAQEMVKIASEALGAYSQWFGPYPYPQFTVVDTFFGWNGNECGGLVMIDDRIFNLPHLVRNFVDALLTHEVCHQWWYNLVGTNGYAETWMDEGLAVHFCHKVMDNKVGKNNELITWPDGMGWLPNIHRNDFRYYGMLGTTGRGELGPVIQPMPGFGHLVNLMSMTYDRGGKIVGMIEERLGEAAFLDFMKGIRRKYEYRILRVTDYRRELEAYTGRSWEEFFDKWLYKTGMTDWSIEKVTLSLAPETGTDQIGPPGCPWVYAPCSTGYIASLIGTDRPHHAKIVLRQKGDCNEPTVLGIRLDSGEDFPIRLPIVPGMDAILLPELKACITPTTDGAYVVDIDLPRRPTQIAVDPDKVLLDSNPLNNTWKPEINFRISPVYTQVDETDITNAYDRWNIIVGPWFYGSSYSDPWYTRSEMIGFRAGVYRTQEFDGGAYLAYRTNDRNMVAGVDGLWDHVLIPQMQIGFNVERSLQMFNGEEQQSAGVVFARYVLMYGDSLYLPPFKYVEAYATVLSHPLEDSSQPLPGANYFNEETLAGVHYHQYYLTPYWDPVAGFALDVSYQEGFPIFGEHQYSEQFFGQFSTVTAMPKWLSYLPDSPALDWLKETRLAWRLEWAAAAPSDARVFAFGGGDLFRGFLASQREGDANWIASVEWRVPIWQDIEIGVVDNIATAKNLYLALFYDVGDSYLDHHELGPIAHAVGAGLRLDVSWFGLIERTMLRVDAAKTVNSSSPWQVWFGIEQPF